jgi:hypothetical protein
MHYMPNPNADDTETNTNDMPLMWALTPYRLKDEKIEWLEESKTPREVQWYDENAQIEHERCVQLVLSLSMLPNTRSKMHPDSST